MKSANYNILIETKKYIFILPLVVLFIICCVSQKAALPSQASKPNVLIIFTDDHRYTGVHALANTQVQTPHIDALAEDGIAFTKTYLMGSFSGATCIPSRAMLLTGRDLFKLEGHGHTIPEAHVTLSETFGQSGYHTHIVGKWNQDKGSLFRSFHSGGKLMGLGIYLTDQYRMPYWDWDTTGEFAKDKAYLIEFDKNGNSVRRKLSKEDKRGPIATELDAPHVSEVFADNAIEYLNQYEDQKPFLLYLAFPTPHDPRQAPASFKRLYPEEDIELPPSYMPQHPFDNGHMILRDEVLAPFPRTEEIIKKELSDYYSIITHLDAQIGKVIHSLKENGQYDNTLIVFAGDSGLAVGNHGLMGKQNVYDEDGLHVPLIFSGGFMELGHRKSNALSYIHDIFPTICDLVGVTAPPTVNGKSLAPVINTTTEEIRTSSYHAYRQFQRAYRKGDYKLIEYVRAKDAKKDAIVFEAGSRVTQLFNITQDPWETTDLSFYPEFKSMVDTMRLEMKQQAIALGDNADNNSRETYDFWDFYSL